jgi:hypothetical protein
MRFFGYGFILQVIALVHFLKRRPDGFWIWIIFIGGPIGATAYILIEMIPDLVQGGTPMRGMTRRKRIRILEGLIIDNPSAGNYEELGDLLLEEKKYARARQCFDESLAQRQDSLDPFYRRGLSLFNLGEYAAALNDFEHVVKKDPKYDYSRVQMFYARSLAETDHIDEAMTAFQTLIERSTATEALCEAADFFAEHGRAADAKTLVDKILARRITMPAYQKRRERPWLRRAASLSKKLSAAAADVGVSANKET